MLLSFRVTNHKSLRHEQQLNLTPAFEADRPAGTKWRAVPVTAIYGANASGKSNLIDALSFARAMALSSDRRGEPGHGVDRSPFALSPQAAREESWYVVDAVIDSVRHTYGFGLNDDEVVEEWLHRYPKGRRQIVFERKAGAYRFGTTVDDNLRRMTDITPARVLFLSSSARFEQPDVLPMYCWLLDVRISNLPRSGSERISPLVRLLSDETHRQQVLGLLRHADLGIADVRVERVERVETDESAPREPARRNIDAWIRQVGGAELNSTKPDPGFSVPTFRIEIRFTMVGAEPGTTLGLNQQSAGTRTLLEHLPDVLACLDSGGVFMVDELESSLHPVLARHVVRLFQDPRTNPRGAQLIFATHDTSLLGSNNEWLKRDQVWFIEKDHETGCSSLYPLTDFKPRTRESTERRYLGGGYGAIPFIDDDAPAELPGPADGAESDDA